MNMNQIMKQAQKMQKKMEELQKEAAAEVIEATSGGGMVKVKITGAQEILDIVIEKEIVDPEDITMLQDLIVSAVNEAYAKSKQLFEQKMSSMTGNLPFNIPNMF